jgi:hypothetical protein
MTNLPVPGWYPDPEHADQLRWWDGEHWTETRQPLDPGGGAGGVETAANSGEAAARRRAARGRRDVDSTDALGGSARSPRGAPARAGVAPRPSRGKRRLVVVGGALVAVAAVLVVLFVFVLGSAKPKFTWDGKSIDQAGDTLDAAQQHLQHEVSSRHGATNGKSRCYFAKRSDPPAGASKDDIEDEVWCGPVLFVDGATSRPWLRYRLTATTSDGKAHLRVASSPIDDRPSALTGGLKLQRPDGKSAPSDAGGLEPPAAPVAQPGEGTVAVYRGTSAADGLGLDLHALSKPVVMQGWESGVQVDAIGTVDRFGQGDRTRQAGGDVKIVAARLTALDGEASDAVGDAANSTYGLAELSVVVDGQPVSSVADGLDEFSTSTGRADLAIAVPKSAKSVDLVMKDGGVTQRVSLLTGDPAPGNPKVLRRADVVQSPGPTGMALIEFSKPGYVSANSTVTLAVQSARLTWWGGRRADKHPGGLDKAFLRLRMSYSWTGSVSGSIPPEELELQLPNGSVVAGQDLDPQNGTVWVAFQVPADFTTGKVIVNGSAVSSTGQTTRVVSGTVLQIKLPSS